MTAKTGKTGKAAQAAKTAQKAASVKTTGFLNTSRRRLKASRRATIIPLAETTTPAGGDDWVPSASEVAASPIAPDALVAGAKGRNGNAQSVNGQR